MPDTPMNERNVQAFPLQSTQIGTDEFDNPIYDNAADAEILQAFRKAEISDGIHPGDSTYLQVISNDDMSVTIKAGFAHIQGVQIRVKEDVTLTAEDADPLVDRTDRVVLRLDLVNNDALLAIKEDDTSLTRVAGQTWELGLADLAVHANNAVITQEEITDLRSDSEACGIIEGLINVSAPTPSADEVSFEPFGSLASDKVQDAVEELNATEDVSITTSGLASYSVKKIRGYIQGWIRKDSSYTSGQEYNLTTISEPPIVRVEGVVINGNNNTLIGRYTIDTDGIVVFKCTVTTSTIALMLSFGYMVSA